VCTNDVEEQVFFPAKNFALQEVNTRLRCSGDEIPVYFTIPSNYSTDDIDGNSVVTHTSEKGMMQVAIMLTWQADSTTYCHI
jgi:hypothetical protein